MTVDSFDPEALLSDHGDYLFRCAMARVRNVQVAEEVVQETLVAALETKEQFAGQASVRTWLVGILRHKIIDYFRANSRELPVSDVTSARDTSEDIFDRNGNYRVEPTTWRENPGDAMERREFWQAFEACMAELPARSAALFALREFDGLKSKEIGELLHISSAHLDVLMYRARLRLARCLEARWFAPEKGAGDR